MVRGTMLVATPTHDELPRRFSDFATLGEALDYAATGKRGLNFHDPRCNLTRPYPFSELREDALSRSEEHTSELQSLMLISYAVFCLQKKKLHSPKYISLQKLQT